ncbi:MAG TPA: aminotransferase class I/II-fold pyridoxal phosphate-dependent enzyme, partial [Chthonomonadaceae bacterium]|nr:aminotransferase class I/II-fold pyridoxal phosphate-dependent enzyme [Chthonomonadaceae bacterium]
MGRPIIPSLSRRSFLQASAVTSAALALRVVTEPMLAYAASPSPSPGAVIINANENPLGPCAAAREAVVAMAANGGRYRLDATEAFEKQFAESVGVSPEQVAIYAGSSEPLTYTVATFCSPRASFVTADPSYEAGMRVADDVGARVVQVPLTKNYAHDVRAMLAAAPDAGVFYICTPNNPTGTLT